MSDLPVSKITTESGLTFDSWITGPDDGPMVILLHGFPQSRHTWRRQLPALATAGFRCIAPDQRGYSRGARPDPAVLSNYHYDKLVSDVVEIAEAAGNQGKFHLVGHDWGGQVAWGVAARHPGRLASLTILSRPHPEAFVRALKAPDGDQKHRSRHHRAFLDPKTAGLLLEDGARRLRRNLRATGVPDDAAELYLSVLGNADALEAALAWYRAQADLRVELGAITVPTLYIWGDADASVGPMAAQGTADFISAPYRFEALAGIGHFSTDEAPDDINRLLLNHLKQNEI
ncbi:MAG: alpha/beta fold hydrolase [Alphaproteobacteria bacterium]